MFYINIFLVYSIIGFFFELLVDLILKIKPGSGIMFGPWTPIYGIGVLIMLLLKRFLEKFNLNKFFEIFIYFISVTILITILEQLGGVLLKEIFNKTLWSYTDLKFHITKYIALEVSLGWGVGAIIIAYVINPLIEKLINIIPKFITILIFVLFIIDAVITFLKYI